MKSGLALLTAVWWLAIAQVIVSLAMLMSWGIDGSR